MVHVVQISPRLRVWKAQIVVSIIQNHSVMKHALKRIGLSNIGEWMMVEESLSGKELDNCWVVPYNCDLCVKYDAHINIEKCAQKKVIKYLHKYIHKGPDQATFVIEDNVDSTDAGGYPQCRKVDEIKQYLDGRYISSIEVAGAYLSLKLHTVICPSKCCNFTYPDSAILFSMMMKIWMTLLSELNVASVCSWDGFKLIKLTMKQMVIHMLNSQSIMFRIEDSRNGLGDKNRYVLVDFLSRILTLRRDTT